jgi:hypothetical protein
MSVIHAKTPLECKSLKTPIQHAVTHSTWVNFSAIKKEQQRHGPKCPLPQPFSGDPLGRKKDTGKDRREQQ